MKLDLDDETELFRSVVREFLDDQVDSDSLRTDHGDAGYDAALFGRMVELGWIDAVLPGAGDDQHAALRAVVLANELGRAGVPSPLLASVQAGILLAASSGADGPLVAELRTGTLGAALVCSTEEELPRVDADGRVAAGSWLVPWATGAQTLAVLASSETGLRVLTLNTAQSGVRIEPSVSYANERIAQVTLDDRVNAAPRGGEGLTEAWALVRLMDAASTLGSAERMLELAAEHVRTRRQFGQRLADFQAVKHHCANMSLRLTAARLTLLESASAYTFGLAARTEPVATRAVCSAVRFTAAEAAQLHGGVGFITEHILHVFYNRCHAGEARLGGRLRQVQRAADVLVDLHTPGWDGPLAWAGSGDDEERFDFAWDRQSRSFVSGLRDWLASVEHAHVVRDAVDVDLQEHGPVGAEFLKQLGAAGWLGLGWPEEYGGAGREGIDRWLFVQEMDYRGLPHGGMGASSIGPTILHMGTDDQRARYLPGLLRGEIDFALGYTEPEAGTDLASLRTRAVRDGDEYVVNGQKVFTTAAHLASHVWLAVRTGDISDRHRGISVLMVDLSTPGITIRELTTQSGGRTNEVFYDNVRVPVRDRLGEENEGWQAIMMALDFERVMPYARSRFLFDQLVRWSRTTRPDDVPWQALARETLAELGVRVEEARVLAMQAVQTARGGRNATVISSMVKVWISDLRLDLGRAGLDLFGEQGQLSSADAPCDGAVERALRAAPMLRFAGGTNEKQRDLIADRGLGLR